MLFKCERCGDTLFSEEAYKAHRTQATDRRVQICQVRYGTFPVKTWVLESDGAGGMGLVGVKRLYDICVNS